MNAIFYQQQKRDPLTSFEAGLNAHGVQTAWRSRSQYRPCPLAVTWAHKTPVVHQGQRARGLDYIVMEMGYTGDRRANVSCGFNGLNGRAEFHNANSPGDRWAKHGVDLKPWKAEGEYVLVTGQVVGDASLEHCKRYPEWLVQACKQAAAYGKPVRFRAHPKFSGMRPPAPKLEGSLEAALAGANCLITWNSNSAVDAILAGVPAVVCDPGSMAWSVSAHRIGDELVRPDRTQWAHDLAYTQWTWAELASGEAWAHLKRHFNGAAK